MTDIAVNLTGMAKRHLNSVSPNSSANTRDEFDVTISDTVGKPFVKNAKMSSRNCDVFYGDKQAIFNINLDIGNKEIMGL